MSWEDRTGFLVVSAIVLTLGIVQLVAASWIDTRFPRSIWPARIRGALFAFVGCVGLVAGLAVPRP